MTQRVIRTIAEAAVTRLISTGTTEQALLVPVARLFPELTPAELSAALQEATDKAERQALRPVYNAKENCTMGG